MPHDVHSSQTVTGDTDMTQQCLDHNSPRERSIFHRRNATTKTPLPTNHRSRHDHAEMPKSERSTGKANAQTQQCRNKSAFPASYRGPTDQRRNAISAPPPPNLGHSRRAEMPRTNRPITRGQSTSAEMPNDNRLAI